MIAFQKWLLFEQGNTTLYRFVNSKCGCAFRASTQHHSQQGCPEVRCGAARACYARLVTPAASLLRRQRRRRRPLCGCVCTRAFASPQPTAWPTPPSGRYAHRLGADNEWSGSVTAGYFDCCCVPCPGSAHVRVGAGEAAVALGECRLLRRRQHRVRGRGHRCAGRALRRRCSGQGVDAQVRYVVCDGNYRHLHY